MAVQTPHATALPSAASHLSNTLKGIVLTVVSMIAFTVLDASGKYVIQTVPLPVAVFFRYLLAVIFAGALIALTGGTPLLMTRHPVLQVARGMCLLAATLMNFLAMSYLQLAQTSAINFTIPLWVCALSVPLLGEHVGLRRWLGVLTGFLGVLVIMRPGTANFHWVMLVSLASALMGALYNLATRKVGGHDKAETSLFYVGLVGSAGAALPAMQSWQMPQGMEWIPILLMGVAGTAGHFMLISAHRLASAASLAPFIYTQIIWMTIAGYLLFNNTPDFWTIVGAAIVVASSIYVFAREQAHSKATALPAPQD
jgi:drug/metabolite transporter (DMT)-like permease